MHLINHLLIIVIFDFYTIIHNQEMQFAHLGFVER